MLKLAKYLKPYLFSVIFSLLLLFGQTMGELELPNLMSNIVNVGLQQGGFEHAAPEALSPEAYALITAYMPDADKTLADTYYQPVSPGATSPDGPAADTLFPAMGESVYTRWYIPPEVLPALDEVFARAAYAFTQRLTALAGDAPAAAEGSAAFTVQTLYQAHGVLQAIAPVAAPEANAATDMFAQQTGIMLARAFAAELGVDGEAVQSRHLYATGLRMLLLAFLAGLAAVVVGYFAPRIASGVSRDLRRDLFDKVEQFSHHEFDKLSSASLITRCTNDVAQIQMFVGMGLRMLCSAPIMCVGGIIMAVEKSVSMSWIIALAVLILIGTAAMVVVVALPKFKINQKLIDRLNKVSREILSGLMVVRAFGAQRHETGRFDQANQDLTRLNLFIGRVMAVIGPVITFIMSGASLLVIWVGAGQIADSQLQIGDMMAFMQYAMQVIISFMMLTMMLFIVPRAAVSAERIAEVLDAPLSITDPPTPRAFDPAKAGMVVFDRVSFRHHDAEEDALTDISFTARPGQTTAIIGPTGAGKTTLVNLLLRFYDVSAGGITVAGTDIRQTRQADLRARIGYVPQKGQLLAGTIADNIRYGSPAATDGEVRAAAETAQAADFIAEKENGLDADISQGGVNVSGGQKQRLSIARALAKKPEILVFDDSFSALDFQTDAKLRRALKETTAQATVILVAQRVGTIMGAEQILVLDEGRIVGRGTHSELLANCPAYAEIASSQLEGGAANG